MKTKVRVIYPATNPREEFEHLFIQVLRAKNKHYPDDLDVVCTIKFQGTVAEQGRADYWYGPSIDMKADFKDHDSIAYVAKLAKFIWENRGGTVVQPDKLLLLIGAEQYFHDGRYIPLSYKGMSCYWVISKTGAHYSQIYAANEALAEKELNKKYPEMSLRFHHIVTPV